jgi:hypothetical protein
MIGARRNFLFPVKALSWVFRGKFLDLLTQACDRGKIQAASEGLKKLRQKNWIVYAKKPFGSPHTVLDYLGRYTHRVALSNDRILSVHNGQVTLSYRDRRDGDRKKTMTLEAHEFIRRFLLHVLPDGFMRIRHFGFLANRAKKHSLPLCRKLWDLIPLYPNSPKDRPKICCGSSAASILTAALPASRGRWSLWPNCQKPLHGTPREKLLCLSLSMDQRGDCAGVCFSVPACLALLLQRHP